MITKFKLFEKINKWNFDDNYIYHYTNEENAIKILKDGNLIPRQRTHINKYSSTHSDDYGYISFTEDWEYHFEDHDGVPTEVRFAFNKKMMNDKYNLQNFNANEESENIYNDRYGNADDLDRANDAFDNYGNEYEIRVYEESIPISDAIRLEYEDVNVNEEIKTLCKDINLKLIEFTYE